MNEAIQDTSGILATIRHTSGNAATSGVDGSETESSQNERVFFNI